MVGRWSGPRLPVARALAADGKRIRGANRNGNGRHETVALVDHESGAPFALLNFDDDGGELAAMHDLLGRSDISGKVITLDALHTTRKTAKLVTQRADYVFVVKGNALETFDILDSVDWDRDASGSFAEDLDKVHGRLEQRSISVLTPPDGLVNYPGVSQIARVTRYREPRSKGPDDAGKGEKDYMETRRATYRSRCTGGDDPRASRGPLAAPRRGQVGKRIGAPRPVTGLQRPRKRRQGPDRDLATRDTGPPSVHRDEPTNALTSA